MLADRSERALRQSHGLMVNYLYDLDDIEKNHEAYAQQRTVVAAERGDALVAVDAGARRGSGGRLISYSLNSRSLQRP